MGIYWVRDCLNLAPISRHLPRACKQHLDATFSLRCFSTEVNAFPGSADDIARALGWVK